MTKRKMRRGIKMRKGSKRKRNGREVAEARQGGVDGEGVRKFSLHLG